MLPGFFLTFLYLIYILGWAIINPKIAPKLSPDQYRVAVPEWLKRLESGRSRSEWSAALLPPLFRPGLLRGATTPDGHPVGYGLILNNVLALMVPVALTVGHIRSDLVVRHHLQRAGGANCVRSRPPAAAAAPTDGCYGTAAAATRACRGKAAGARAGGVRGCRAPRPREAQTRRPRR